MSRLSSVLPLAPAMRVWLVGCLLACAGCQPEPEFKVPVEYSVPTPLRPAEPKAYPTKWTGTGVVTVARGVHVLASVEPSVAFAIETSDGLILIDASGDEAAASVRGDLLRLQLDAKDVRHILLTHAHYDHVLGASELKRISGATVHAGKADSQTIRSADTEALFSVFPAREITVDTVPVDRELSDGDSIELGDTVIEALSMPGHTPGSMCYRMQRDGDTILFAGDVIASLNFGPAIYPVDLSPKYRGDAKDYLRTLDRLLALEQPDLVLPGHPNQHRLPRSIRMEPSDWRTMLESSREEVEQIIARHEADGRDFLDDVAKPIEPDLDYLGLIQGTAIYALQADESLVLFNAAGGEAFQAFVRERLDSMNIKRVPDFLVLGSNPKPEDEASLIAAVRSMGDKIITICPDALWDTLNSQLDGPVLSTTEWPDSMPPFIRPFDLSGSVVYEAKLADKSILITPDAPRNLALIWTNPENNSRAFGPLQPNTDDFMAELNESADIARWYRAALKQLGDFNPDIWLPLHPSYGQNANIYDGHWSDVLRSNRRLLPAEWFLNSR